MTWETSCRKSCKVVNNIFFVNDQKLYFTLWFSLGLAINTNGSAPQSRFSAYKNYGQTGELSESEVTSSLLNGHESMMAVLASRGRNLEITHKLWQNKDAKTGE